MKKLKVWELKNGVKAYFDKDGTCTGVTAPGKKASMTLEKGAGKTKTDVENGKKYRIDMTLGFPRRIEEEK